MVRVLPPSSFRPDRRVALLAGMWLCAACTSGHAYREGSLPIATGAPDGVYYRYGQRLAYWLQHRLDRVRPSVDSTTGSVENLHRLSSGRDLLAFVAADAAGAAASGQGGRPTIGALARLYDDYIHLAVARAAPIKSIGDLRGRRVSLGAAGSGVEIVARRVLSAAGLHPIPVHLGLEDSITALRAGRIDAFFWSGGLPTAGVMQLARLMPTRLIPLDTLAPVISRRNGPYYRAATIPQGTYEGVDAVPTLALANYLVAPTTLDDGLVYRVTDTLIRKRDAVAEGVPSAESLNVRDAIQTGPLPLHAGALRYYRSIKP